MKKNYSLTYMINYSRMKLNFQKNNFTLIGYSRSGVRTGIYLPEWDIMMDAGVYFNRKPRVILVTHGHLDHVCNLYSSCLDNINKPTIFCPPSSVGFLKHSLNSQHTVSLNRISKFFKYKMIGLEKEYDIQLSRKFKITPYDMDHRIPTIGFGISMVDKKLNPEFKGMDKSQLIALKKSGKEINVINIKKMILFCGDTSQEALAHLPFNKYAYVIIECTFLDREHYKEALNRKHLHYFDLKSFIEKNKDTTFILIHFSQRYSDSYIKDFFKSKNHSNVKLFISNDKNQDKISENNNFKYYIVITFLVFIIFSFKLFI